MFRTGVNQVRLKNASNLSLFSQNVNYNSIQICRHGFSTSSRTNSQQSFKKSHSPTSKESKHPYRNTKNDTYKNKNLQNKPPSNTLNNKSHDNITGANVNVLDVVKQKKDGLLTDSKTIIRALPSATVAHLSPELLAYTDKQSWLPARRQRTPFPVGLPPKAIDKIIKFESKLTTPIHEDTSRILSLPKVLGGFGFSELTVVQKHTIPPLAQGLDVLVRAPTGTGKTLAYLIPIIERLMYMRVDPHSRQIPVVILCPTRELSLQTTATIKHLLGLHARNKDREFNVTCVVGGTSSTHVEQEPLSEACTFLVGTPGRINDHINQTPGFKARLSGVRVVVMDEVDFLLKSCLSSDLANIIKCVPVKHQTIMFSATLNKSVRTVAKFSLRAGHQVIDLIADPDQPIRTNWDEDEEAELEEAVEEDNEPMDLESSLAEVDDEFDDELELYAATPAGARQYIVPCDSADALAVIARLADDIAGRYSYAYAQYQAHLLELKQSGASDIESESMIEKPKPPKILVFCPTGRYAQFACATMRKIVNPGKKSGFEAILEMHSKKNQNYRVRAANQFAGDSWEQGVIMFSSDVASRGMDFSNVDLVVQIGVPSSRNQYIQRVGRTARAGNNGLCLILVEPEDIRRTKQMLISLPLEMPDYGSLHLNYNDDVPIDEIYAEQYEMMHLNAKERRKALRRGDILNKEVEKMYKAMYSDEDVNAEAFKRVYLDENGNVLDTVEQVIDENYQHIEMKSTDIDKLDISKLRQEEEALLLAHGVGFDGAPVKSEVVKDNTKEVPQSTTQSPTSSSTNEPTLDNDTEHMNNVINQVQNSSEEYSESDVDYEYSENEIDHTNVKIIPNLKFAEDYYESQNQDISRHIETSQDNDEHMDEYIDENEDVEETTSDNIEEGEELWDHVIERACAPLIIRGIYDEEIRAKRLRTLQGQTMSFKGISGLDKFKTYEHMFKRVIEKVHEDDDMGLNAERAYVSLLGLWRSTSTNPNKNPLKKGLDSVTDAPILSKKEVSRRALLLGQGLGLCGPDNNLPLPNIPERVAKRLGLMDVKHINVGPPRRYQKSEFQNVKKHHGHQYRGKKEPAAFREYSKKYSKYNKPLRLRTGEMIYKVRPTSTDIPYDYQNEFYEEEK